MGLTQERISEEARAILQDVGLGILDKVDQFINEVSALNTLAIDCFKTGGYEMAENHLLTALKIDKDNADTLLNLGRLYNNPNWHGHNPTSAFDMFQRASDAGSVKAKTGLGHCYLEGTGTNIDYSRAHGLLREAAEAGDPPAMSLLGLSYLAGQGVEKDEVRGIELITRGAKLGDMEAQSTLSMIYSSGGLGVVEDKKKALEWAIKAAAQGDVPSMEYINEVTNDARSRFK